MIAGVSRILQVRLPVTDLRGSIAWCRRLLDLRLMFGPTEGVTGVEILDGVVAGAYDEARSA